MNVLLKFHACDYFYACGCLLLTTAGDSLLVTVADCLFLLLVLGLDLLKDANL